jgi:hypothetical protein
MRDRFSQSLMRLREIDGTPTEAASVPYRKEGAMPRKTIKISAEERDALYDQVRNHLAALGDVFVAMECQKDYATAERLGIEFGEDFRLLQDLGWPENDGRERVDLTMPYEDLTELMRRLLAEAQGGLVDARKEREAVAGADVIEGLESTIQTCSEVIEAIGLQERGPQAQRT